MKAKVILVALALAVAGFVAAAGAQSDAEQPNKADQLRQQFLEERAEVLSQVFEKRAELVRLSAKKVPDVKEVQRLVKEISELRSRIWKKCEEYRATAAALGQPALAGARRWGLGPGCRYNVGRGQRWLGSGSEWGRSGRGGRFRPERGPAGVGVGVRSRRARGRDEGFGPGRSRAAPRPQVRGRGATGGGRASAPGRSRAAPRPQVRGRASAPGRGWAPPQAGERGRGPLGRGFGPTSRPMMGGRGMRLWGPGPLSDDVGDQPAPPSE